MTSAVTYYRRTSCDVRTALPMALLAFLASFSGAIVTTIIPADIFTPLIVLALGAVLLFTIFKPQAGELTVLKFAGKKHLLITLGIGAGIGFYDGILGPGTGSFLMIAMMLVLGYSLLQSAAQTKIVNAATNLGALILFALGGHQVWLLGALMGMANMLGGYLGARTAIFCGSRVIRILMICVVSALILTLSWDFLTS